MKSSALKEKLIDAFNKDKKVFIFVLAGILGVLLILISEINFEPEENIAEINENQVEAYEYCDYLEKKIEEIVSSIDGAGKVKVMITLSESVEYVYAQNQDDTKKINENSENSDNKSDFVIIENEDNDSGLLIKTYEPKIRGVAIVCSGGDNANVQQQIYSTVSAVLNVSTARISISKLSPEKE